MMEILISNRQKIKINNKVVVDLCDYAMKRLNINEQAELSISFVEPDEIRELSKKYRKKDKETDVLSFSFNDDINEYSLLGDIIICPKKIEEMTDNKDDFNERFALLLVHSILHLIGHSHKDEKSAKVMSNKEEQILDEYRKEKLNFI